MNLYYNNNDKTPKHKTFLSFHHKDEGYRDRFEQEYSEDRGDYVSRSVKDGDIDPTWPTERIRQKIRDEFISDATVTLVLISPDTWKRKHVDWEISSSIRDTKNNPRNGLLGILLPNYQYTMDGCSYADIKRTESGRLYNPFTIPPRLFENVQCGYAKIYSWPATYNDVKKWIHDAYLGKEIKNPSNAYPLFSKNRNDDQRYWQKE
ncbi:MAG: hypothetical protein AUK31_01680 [Fibrobacteres bacterium CG2_30_45_31]|nr:MAG: hypothetical protein AUK31_01680 [Fibrobacteres bacterium CG2_30_45_31]